MAQRVINMLGAGLLVIGSILAACRDPTAIPAPTHPPAPPVPLPGLGQILGKAAGTSFPACLKTEGTPSVAVVAYDADVEVYFFLMMGKSLWIVKSGPAPAGAGQLHEVRLDPQPYDDSFPVAFIEIRMYDHDPYTYGFPALDTRRFEGLDIPEC
jgi:hypothetical protein